MSKVLANHISENAKEAFYVICGGSSWMFMRNTIACVKLPAPLSTLDVDQQCR